MNRSSPVTGFFVLGKKIALSLKVVSNTKREGHSGFDVGSGYDKEDFDMAMQDSPLREIPFQPENKRR